MSGLPHILDGTPPQQSGAPEKSPAGNGGAFSSEPVQPFLPFIDATWVQVRDANDTGRALFHRHYSFHRRLDGRVSLKYSGPGETMVLLTPDAKALFVWRKFRSQDDQQGINCAVFRNEGAALSSDLIRAADELAFERWPGERHYTYVNPKKIRSINPGCCFIKAGWRRCGITQKRKYLIFERAPGALGPSTPSSGSRFAGGDPGAKAGHSGGRAFALLGEGMPL